MYNIARIEQLRDSAQQLLAEQEAKLLEKPNSFYRQMLVESARAQVDELIRQIVEEKKKREVEVIEIRLIGEKAHHGSLPMNVIGELSSAFEEMLVQAGRFIKYGVQSNQPVQEIRSLLDVRLKRLASGSTRMLVTARTNPDMFGNSLAEDSLTNTFNLLTSDKLSEFTEHVNTLGKHSVSSLNRFLKTLTETDLQAHINWQTPTDEVLNWEGTRERIGLLQHTLANVSQDDPKEISFEGEILMESIRPQTRNGQNRSLGKFEIKDYKTGRIYKGKAPQPVLPSLLALYVGEGCKGILLETVTDNKTTGDQKRSYELKRIEPMQLLPKTAIQLQLPF